MKGETINSINKNTKYKIDMLEPRRELNKNLHELRTNTFTFYVEVQTTRLFKRFFIQIRSYNVLYKQHKIVYLNIRNFLIFSV